MSDRVLALALCWRLERRDGVTLALTAHDRDLVVDGLVYRAAPGMTPSAVALGSGLDADTMAAEGAFTAAAITARDLADGRWDGARVVCLAVDWSDPAAAPLPLGEGRIGAVTARDRDFTAELSGAQARLDRPAVELTAPSWATAAAA
ncbi:putative phage protein (TIGR02218 family) [Sphingomonas sp. BK580]|nr:putative phage protein (TIGR02218 family) [Sphingomonas sp. BK580]